VDSRSLQLDSEKVCRIGLRVDDHMVVIMHSSDELGELM